MDTLRRIHVEDIVFTLGGVFAFWLFLKLVIYLGDIIPPVGTIPNGSPTFMLIAFLVSVVMLWVPLIVYTVKHPE